MFGQIFINISWRAPIVLHTLTRSKDLSASFWHPDDYAQRPLDTKLLLKEKLVSELLCFPQALKGTTMIVLLSSEPYWRAWDTRKPQSIRNNHMCKGLMCLHQLCRSICCETEANNHLFKYIICPVHQVPVLIFSELPLWGRCTGWWCCRSPDCSWWS